MIALKLWGTRGSLATPGLDTVKYGGNTACVEVRGQDGTLLILDAGTGIRLLSTALDPNLTEIHLLLTHLHMDHIQGLGFFGPLYNPRTHVHIWGPASHIVRLSARLGRYMSPPLFPVRLMELPCKLTIHEIPHTPFTIGEFTIMGEFICHPGPTVGYRITSQSKSIAYIPDHEPALGTTYPLSVDWLSGYKIANNVDLLIHDAQYSPEEYPHHIGWGHSSLHDACHYANAVQAARMLPFHYDPRHNDAFMDNLMYRAQSEVALNFDLIPAYEGHVYHV
ncbi:MAG TPA: MBL fold metallo-hydrolase [Anaerolineae bacterium]|nr:MBL fold metallo-hydrolase [Anaerolineae bacterium]